MNGMTWKDFVDSIREDSEPTPFKSKAQKGYKAQRRKNDIYTTSGGHKNAASGSPYTTKAKRFGTDKLRFEGEVEPESFDTHDTLEPNIWDGQNINQNIRKRLLKIAKDLIENISSYEDENFLVEEINKLNELVD